MRIRVYVRMRVRANVYFIIIIYSLTCDKRNFIQVIERSNVRVAWICMTNLACRADGAVVVYFCAECLTAAEILHNPLFFRAVLDPC